MKSNHFPEILVVVTAHNYGRFLTRCLNSVLDQTYDDWHLVVVDDGSSDNTPDIIRHYADDDRITLLRLPGFGLVKAANTGITSVDSRWIFRLDADDWLEPDCLERLRHAAEISGAHLVYPDYNIVDAAGNFIQKREQGHAITGPGNERSPLAAGCLYQRSCWQALGGYDETLKYQEDFDFWLKFIEKFSAFHLKAYLFNYRQHDGSMSTNRYPRAETRRTVKKQAVKRLGRAMPDDGVPLLILTTSPADMRLSFNWALNEISGQSPLDILYNKVLNFDFIKPKRLLAAGKEIEDWGRERGFEVIPARTPLTPGQDLFAAAYDLIDPQKLTLVASPLYPQVHEGRINEVIDTILLHDCCRVETVILVERTILSYRNQGLQPLYTIPPMAEGPVLFLQAGGLAAIRGENIPWTVPSGYVEILPPEDNTVVDMLSNSIQM